MDFGAVMERMRKLRAQIAPNDSAQRFSERLGVDVYIGHGKFLNKNTVQVNGQELGFHKAVIASGARAAVPPIKGLQETGYLTNANVWNLTELPPRLAVIGSGAIGCELAQCFARFGSQVTILFRSDRIMTREDPEAAAIVSKSLENDGIRLLSGARTQRARKESNGEKVLEVIVDGLTRLFASLLLHLQRNA